MSLQTDVIEVLRDCADKTSAKVLTQLQQADPLIEGVWFDYGHYTDIKERLATKKDSLENATRRFPLIAVLEDFSVRKGGIGLTGVTAPLIVILSETRDDYTRQQRQDRIFTPILIPVYEEYLRQIEKSGAFQVYSVSQIKHEMVMRPHHGKAGDHRNMAYYFDDVLDGIELRNLELKTYLKTCLRA